jgi:hypothetical protein
MSLDWHFHLAVDRRIRPRLLTPFRIYGNSERTLDMRAPFQVPKFRGKLTGYVAKAA